MRKSLLVLAFIVPGLASNQAIAEEQQSRSTDVIQGLGERVPVGKENVSLSPLFKVYTFEKSGLTFAQVNSSKDEVITVIVIAPGVQSRLPIGSAAEEHLAAVNDEKDHPPGKVTAAASCPCSATAVYRDATASIVVTYNSNGKYIASAVIPSASSPSALN